MLVGIGECMVEVAPNGVSAYQLSFAGDTYNACWTALLALKSAAPVRYVTAIGKDWMSDLMFDSFACAGIETSFVRRMSDLTVGLYAIRVVDGERSFAYWRRDSAATRLANDPAFLNKSLAGARIVLVSGITVAIMPPEGRSTLWTALQNARMRGTEIAFDPNYRPRLWQDTGEARREIERFLAIADVALPSFSDEADLFGDADPHAAVQRIRACGAADIVMKNGPASALCLLGDQMYDVPACAVPQVIDTTGAGDAFNGAFLAARLGGARGIDAVRAGHAMASRAVMSPGALLPRGL